jgi:hypothetical protein
MTRWISSQGEEYLCVLSIQIVHPKWTIASNRASLGLRLGFEQAYLCKFMTWYILALLFNVVHYRALNVEYLVVENSLFGAENNISDQTCFNSRVPLSIILFYRASTSLCSAISGANGHRKDVVQDIDEI